MEHPRKLAFKPRLEATERRETIELAASKLFASRGYEASSLEEIARAAGITKRVIYDHFASKRDLNIAILRKRTEELLTLVAGAVDSEAAPAERLAAGIEAFFRFVQAHPDAWRMLFRDPPADPQIAAAHREVQARATGAIAAMLATHPGVRRTDVASQEEWQMMMAEQLKSALNGLAGWWYLHSDVPRSRLVSAAVDFAWHGLRGLTSADQDHEGGNVAVLRWWMVWRERSARAEVAGFRLRV